MKLPILSKLLFAAAIAGAVFARAETPDVPFSVGTSRREITPKEPVPMWGYGARHDALSTGVLDPLYATGLVIQAGTNKLAIVGLDLGRSPTERSLQLIRLRIKAEAGIDYSFIAGSHTHHGPVLELSNEDGKGKGKFDAALRYYKQMEDGIVAAIVAASTNLTPAKMATGSIQLEGFNRNRHTKLQPKPSDRELAVMRFDDFANKPLAVLVNFTAHPTMVNGAELKFSADYVGALKETIEKEMKTTALFMQGASGDQSVNAGTNKSHQAFGQALAREAIKLASGLVTKEVTQPSLQVKEERFKFTSRVDLTNPMVRSGYAIAFFPELVGNYADEYTDGV